MTCLNPYELAAGPELDAAIHCEILGLPESGVYPSYSTNPKEAENVRRHIETKYGIAIFAGKTNIAEKPWFARYEMEIGNPTEVLAETYSLAICRLAFLRARRGGG